MIIKKVIQVTDQASRDNKYIQAKNNLVNNVENFYKGREKIIEGFKNEAFPFYYDERHEHQMKAQREIEEEEQKKNKIKNHLIQMKLLNG